jgi:hypothetical protein
VCRPKRVEQLRNTEIINSTTRSHLVVSLYENILKFHLNPLQVIPDVCSARLGKGKGKGTVNDFVHLPNMYPGVDSASKNEYQDIPGSDDGRCVKVTTLPPSCAECLEILEP